MRIVGKRNQIKTIHLIICKVMLMQGRCVDVISCGAPHRGAVLLFTAGDAGRRRTASGRRMPARGDSLGPVASTS